MQRCAAFELIALKGRCSMAQDLCARLREKKLISIVRGAPTEKITKIADAIYRGGFRFMEITFDQSGKTPHAVTAEQIRIVRDAFV